MAKRYLSLYQNATDREVKSALPAHHKVNIQTQ